MGRIDADSKVDHGRIDLFLSIRSSKSLNFLIIGQKKHLKFFTNFQLFGLRSGMNIMAVRLNRLNHLRFLKPKV